MNNTVDSQTAIELKAAGFVQPQMKVGQMWYLPGLIQVAGKEVPAILNYVNAIEERVYFSSIGAFVENRDHVGMSLKFHVFYKAVFAPTALEIIEQMPPGTRIQFDLSVWECWFPIAQMQEDFRYDVCPHKAAALAFIAWKKGLE